MDDWRVKLNEYLGIEPGKGRGNKNKVNKWYCTKWTELKQILRTPDAPGAKYAGERLRYRIHELSYLLGALCDELEATYLTYEEIRRDARELETEGDLTIWDSEDETELLQTVADIKRRSSPTQQRSNPTQVITMQEQGVQTLISISEKSVVMKTQANEYFAAQPLADGLTQTQGRNENTQSHEDDTQGQQNDTQSRYHQKKRTYVQAMDSFSFSPAHTQRTQDNPSEDMPVMPRRKSERLSTDLLLIGGDEDAGSGVHTGGIETNAGDDDDAFGILREIHREKLGKESGHSSDDVYVSPSPGIGANSPVVATLSPIVDSPSNHQNVIDLSPEILHSDPDDSEDYMPMPKNTSVKSEDTKEQKSRDFLARFASPVEPTASALPHSVPSGFMDLNFGDRKLKPELLRQLAEHCGLWASKNVSLVTLRIELQKIQTYFQSVLSPDQPDK